MSRPRVRWLHRKFRFLLTPDERIVFEGAQGGGDGLSTVELRGMMGDEAYVQNYIDAYKRLPAEVPALYRCSACGVPEGEEHQAHCVHLLAHANEARLQSELERCKEALETLTRVGLTVFNHEHGQMCQGCRDHLEAAAQEGLAALVPTDEGMNDAERIGAASR